MKKLLPILRIIFLSLLITISLSNCGNTETSETSNLSDNTEQVSDSTSTTGSNTNSDDATDEESDDTQKAKESTPINIPWVAIIIGLLLAGIITIVVLYLPISLWIKSWSAGNFIWPHTLIAFKIAHVDVNLMVETLITAREAGLKISIHELASMFHARIDVWKVIQAYITSHNGGLGLTLQEIKSHFLSNGDVEKVVQGMIASKNADLRLSGDQKMNLGFEQAAAIDLAGIDLADAIRNYVIPKVLETEDIQAVSKDGIEIFARVRVTVRANLNNIVSGADKETILAVVNEALVTFVGGCKSHKDILESAYEVGESVMSRREDMFEGFAYDVLSVDVSNIRIGKDIGATLDIEKAEAKIIQEKAREAEKIADAAEAHVLHIRAEAEVQLAMAEAFRDGTLSIHDYHNMMNTEADTVMRKSFAKNPIDQKSIQTSGNHGGGH